MMQFIVKRWLIGDKQGWAFQLLDDRLEKLCSLAVPEDTITDWHGAWVKLTHSAAGREQCDKLLTHVQGLSACDVGSEIFLTFMRVCYGLLEFLQSEPHLTVSNRDNAIPALKDFLDRHFTFRQLPHDDYAILLVVNGQSDIVKLDPRRLRYQLTPSCISIEDWWAVFRKKKAQAGGDGGDDFVETILQYYEFLYPAAKLQQNNFVIKSFVNLTKALVERIEREDLYQHYRNRLADLHMVIVCYEEDLNVARDRLLHLLRSQESPAEKWRRLTYLIHDLKRARHGMSVTSDSFRRYEEERLAALTGLIADHYLDRYDLPRAMAAWKQLGLKDLFLKTLLFFVDHSKLILIFHVMAFIVMIGLALMQFGKWLPFPPLLPMTPFLSQLTLFLLLVGPLWVTWGILYNLFKNRLYYSQLFLPRMYGAIVVGLSVLLLDDLPWKIGIQIPGALLLVLVLNVLFLSYLYIRFDVYQTIKFELWSEGDHEPHRSKSKLQLRRLPIIKWFRKPSTPKLRRKKSTFAYARRVAWQIFSIGVIQSFLVTLFVSGLLFPVALKIFDNGFSDGSLLLRNSLLGWIEIKVGTVKFIVVPTLVLLWTSMALFIGAFAQLLWQGRHVTSPVSE